ncbi:ATP-binding protein, partial [Actinosynnema sp. NPDC023658]|uniref:ATP-binding protein n=1 Tax=Actinosynnema sp. NPDC023658 TaxID=3155465 RepID=UPI0034116C48
MTTWPVRGRDQDVDRVVEALTTGTGSAVLTGPGGIGKTRLAREVADRVTASGWDLTWVAATAALSDIPFGAFLPHLDSGLDTPADLREQLRLYRLIRHFTAGTGGGRLLVVDDAHELDRRSVGLVHQLAVVGRVHLLLTVRSGRSAGAEIAPLWRDGYAERLELSPLDRAGVRSVLEGALAAKVDELTVQRMREWTGGNALHLRQLTEVGLASGALRRSGPVWTWSGAPAAGDLGDVVDDRFVATSESERVALAALAMAEPLDQEVLEAVADRHAVGDLLGSELVVLDQSGSRPALRLAHPLFRRPALALLPERARSGLRRALATALAEEGKRHPAAALRAITLELDAGDHPADEKCLDAADQALRLGDPVLAERCARNAGPSA